MKKKIYNSGKHFVSDSTLELMVDSDHNKVIIARKNGNRMFSIQSVCTGISTGETPLTTEETIDSFISSLDEAIASDNLDAFLDSSIDTQILLEEDCEGCSFNL